MKMEGDSDPKLENQAVLKLSVYILVVVVMSAVMLAVNTGLIFSLAQGVSEQLPEVAGIPQMIQLLIFVGPIVLLYLEWWAWDLITAKRSRNKATYS